MKELTTAERKVYDFIMANQPVADTEIGKAFAKSVPRAKEFLPRLQRNGYISVYSKEKHGNVQILFYCVKSPSKSEDVTFDDTFTKMGTDTTEQTTPPEEAPQTTPPEEASTTDQTTPTMEEAPTTTEEALQATPTNEAPTTKQIADSLGNYFSTHPNAPQSHTDGENSVSEPQDVQVTDEDLKKAYKEVLAGRRYGQIPFDILDGIRQDLELSQLSASQACQIILYVGDALRGIVPAAPTAKEIIDPVVRVYVSQWLRDRNTLTPDEYVGYMMQKQRHWKVRVGTKAVDVSNTQWAQHLLNQYERKK